MKRKMTRKRKKWNTVTPRDIKKVKMLYDTNQFSIQGIADVVGRAWCTINNMIEANFDFDEYAKIRSLKESKKKRNLTFKPFKEENTPGPVKVQKIPVEPENDTNTLNNDKDVLEYMYDLQQKQAKRLMKKTERNEAIHKIRNGLQKLSEGLGELL
tara:strand:- start:281 stop:748 length:468 start_codon:yes stop_codon:yes gene_type:complete